MIIITTENATVSMVEYLDCVSFRTGEKAWLRYCLCGIFTIGELVLSDLGNNLDRYVSSKIVME